MWEYNYKHTHQRQLVVIAQRLDCRAGCNHLRSAVDFTCSFKKLPVNLFKCQHNGRQFSLGSCLHAADDVDGLRPHAEARLLHVNDRHREVDVAAPLAKSRVTEHFQVWREEILQYKYTRVQDVIYLNTAMVHM